MLRSLCAFASISIVLAAQPLQARGQPRIRIPVQVLSESTEDDQSATSAAWHPRETVRRTASDGQSWPGVDRGRAEPVVYLDGCAPAADAGGTGLLAPVFDPYAQTAAPAPYYQAPPAQAVVVPAPASCASPLRCEVFGEYLLLQPGDAARMSFALPINGAIIPPPDPPVPIGPVATLDPGYHSGFRAGIGFRPNEYGEWDGTYTMFESRARETVAVDPADIVVLHSLVIHPATVAADTVFLDASAGSSIDFDLADVEYRHYFADGRYSLVFVAGARYAHLEQDFDSRFTNVTTIEDVSTRIRFDGGGIRTGLEGEWRSATTGLLVYARGLASFVAGRFRSSFTQQDNFAGVVVNTSQKDDRIVPILDLELGLGWRGPRDHLRLSAGYLFSAWYNVVSTPEFIRAVHGAQFDNVSDTLTFDGFVARAEVRF